MKLWKFVIPVDEVRWPSGASNGMGYAGCLAVVLAESEVEAREIVHREYPLEAAAWLESADVVCLSVNAPALVAWAML